MRSYWYVALLPWLAFTIVVRAGGGQGLAWASGVALATGVLACLLGWRARGLAAPEVASVVTFAALLGAALLLDDDGVAAVERFGRPLATTGLAIAALVSSLGRPFTVRYLTPFFTPGYVDTPAFAALCREVAVLCALTASCVTASHLVGAILDTRVAATAFHWFVPVAVVVVAGETIARRVAAARDDERARAEEQADLEDRLGFLDRPPAPVHRLRPR